jgi:hypothetical protein
MARTTIYVPDDLKERMDRANQATEEVNWSQVACRAFEMKLGELATNKEIRQKQDVIQRLRASKLKSDDSNYKEGLELGRRWAEETAEADDLERLTSGEGWNSADELAEFITGDADDHKAAFWKSVGDDLDSLLKSRSFLDGFVQGAAGVWCQVRDEVT